MVAEITIGRVNRLAVLDGHRVEEGRCIADTQVADIVGIGHVEVDGNVRVETGDRLNGTVGRVKRKRPVEHQPAGVDGAVTRSGQRDDFTRIALEALGGQRSAVAHVDVAAAKVLVAADSGRATATTPPFVIVRSP